MNGLTRQKKKGNIRRMLPLHLVPGAGTELIGEFRLVRKFCVVMRRCRASRLQCAL